MKKFFISVIIAAFIAASFACSKKPAETNTVDANVQQESPFANITDPAAAVVEGDRLMDENQTDSAVQAYQQAIKLNPDLAEAHFKLGIAYGLVEMQMEQDGRAADTLDAKGRTRSEKAFLKAVEAYKKWLDANPNDDVAHYNLGRTYNKLNKDEQAEAEFREAVKLKPEDTEYQTELGDILIKLAKYREAIGPLKKAIELDAENERAITLLEDAEAGRQRIDYISPKNTNQANANKANSNVDANMTSNSNTMMPSNSNSKPPGPPVKSSPTPKKPKP